MRSFRASQPLFAFPGSPPLNPPDSADTLPSEAGERGRALPCFRGRDLLIAAALGVLAVAVHGSFIPHHVYAYDEADYRKAAERSLADHWLDRPSLPLGRFLAQGRASVEEPEAARSASDLVRAGGDLPFLRHYHGPLYWYGLVPAARLAGQSEAALRRSGLAGSLLLASILYLGCVSVGMGRLPAVLAGLFAVLSPELIETFRELNSHGSYVILSAVALLLAGRALHAGSAAAWRGAAAVAGLACAASAFAPLLAAALLLGAAATRSGGWPGRRAAWLAGLRRTLLAGGVLALVWPGAFLRLTPLRGCAFYGYMALARPAAWGHAGPCEAWRARLLAAPAEWAVLLVLLLVGALALWRGGRRPGRSGALAEAYPWAVPFVSYGALMAATTLFITRPHARYMASLLPVLFVLACAAFGALVRGARTRVALVLTIACALALGLLLPGRRAVLAPDPATRLDDRVVENLRRDPPGARLLVPRYYVPIAGWYLPGTAVLGRDGPDALLAETARWRPDAVAYYGLRDVGLEAGLIAARGVEGGESVTLTAGARRVTILRIHGGAKNGPGTAASP